MSNLIDRNEIRRLQKAARDNNKIALYEWASQFENQIKRELELQYEEIYKDFLSTAIDNFIIALAYTLTFSEEFTIGKDRVPDLLDDLFVTIDMFRTEEYLPEDYKKQLIEEGIFIEDVKCNGILSNDKKLNKSESEFNNVKS